MTIEFSRRKFMTSAGGTALTALAVPAAFKKLPGGEAQAVGRDFFSYPQAAVVQSLGEITGGLCYPAPVTAATARRRAGPSPACRVWGSRSAASGRARSWSTTRERSGRGTSAAASTATASTRPGSSRRRRSTFASSWRASRPRSRRWRPRGRRTSDRRARSRPGPGATRWPGTCSARARGRTRRCYPFGWISYTGFKTDVSMRFYTPIVAGEDRRTSLPLAYFDLRIANHTGSTATVSVMFTWPNAAQSVDGAAPTVRTGLSNSADARTGGRGSPPSLCRAMTRRTPPTRTPRSGRSRPSRAPGRPSATCRRGTAAATGPTSTRAFSATGVLGGTPLDDSRVGRGDRRLGYPPSRPDDGHTVRFDLGFPQVTMNNNGTVWMRRYTEFYGARMTGPADAAPGGYNTYIPGSYPFHQNAGRSPSTHSGSADETLESVQSWWAPLGPLIGRSRPSCGPAALNQLGQVTFKTSLWAAGFVSSTESPTLGHQAGHGQPRDDRLRRAGLDQRRQPVHGRRRRRVRVPRLQPVLPLDRAGPAADHGRGDHARPERGPDRPRPRTGTRTSPGNRGRRRSPARRTTSISRPSGSTGCTPTPRSTMTRRSSSRSTRR